MKKFLSYLITAALLISCIAAVAITGSAASYVTDGLVANYDGSKIADGATTWTDASGNGNDIINLPNNDTNYFKDGAYHVSSTKVDLPDAIDTALSGDEFTVEMVIDNLESLGTSWNTFINCPSDDFSLFRLVSSDSIVVKLHPNARPQTPNALETLAGSTVSVTFKVGGKSCLYINGELVSEVDCTTALANTTGMFFGHDDASKNFNADYKAMRFYDKALTAEQIKANYTVDANPAPVETPSEDPSEAPSEAPVAPVEKGENILAGLTYTYEGTIREPDGFSDYNSDGTCKNRLTDGAYAENPGSEQIAAYNGGPTSFVFDLGKVTDIAGFYCDGYSGNWGIPAPTSVEFLVSDDGATYTSVGVVEVNEENTTVVSDPWQKHEFKLDKVASGRYIKVVYTTTVHTWLSEIEAYAAVEGGTTSTDTSSEVSTEKPVETADNGIVALAVIASLAVAGAVIVKKSR